LTPYVAIGILAGIARRHESEAGRRLHLFTRVPDRPGGLAQLLEVVASARANVVAAGHLRDAANVDVGETGVELVLETRGKPHSEDVRRAIRAGGYPIDGPE